MRAEAQIQPAPASHIPVGIPASSGSLPESHEWASKVSLLEHEIEQLQSALEDRGAELQVARGSEAEYRSQCASLQITVASQELQLRAVLAQSASEKSLFLQEKEHLQLLFDKQQQLCVSLTSQVVSLTANCELLQSQAHSNSIKHQLEYERHAKELNQKDAIIVNEQKRCSDATSRANALETVVDDLNAKLDSLHLLNIEQSKQISQTSQQRDEALHQVARYERDALVHEVRLPFFCSLSCSSWIFLPRQAFVVVFFCCFFCSTFNI
jgi:hypothetical protein